MSTRPLKPGELDVLRRIADGMPFTDITRELWLAERTVKNRLAAARTALGARTTAHAISLAYQQGLLTVDGEALAIDAALGTIAAALGYRISPDNR